MSKEKPACFGKMGKQSLETCTAQMAGHEDDCPFYHECGATSVLWLFNPRFQTKGERFAPRTYDPTRRSVK